MLIQFKKQTSEQTIGVGTAAVNFGAGMTAFESADAEPAAETFPFDKSDRKWRRGFFMAACTGGQNLAFIIRYRDL